MEVSLQVDKIQQQLLEIAKRKLEILNNLERETMTLK